MVEKELIRKTIYTSLKLVGQPIKQQMLWLLTKLYPLLVMWLVPLQGIQLVNQITYQMMFKLEYHLVYRLVIKQVNTRVAYIT
jgi:hypothetical protein